MSLKQDSILGFLRETRKIMINGSEFYEKRHDKIMQKLVDKGVLKFYIPRSEQIRLAMEEKQKAREEKQKKAKQRGKDHIS